MRRSAARPLWQGRALALVGIVLFAFTMRTAVASLSPVIGEVGEDFELSAAVIGLIGTAPPACYAIFGILTPRWERRFGIENLVVTASLLVALGLLMRALAIDALMLLLATTLVFAAIGVGNILLPPLVKIYFPDRIGLMTTVYTTTMAVATCTPPLFAVPVAETAGWRFSVGLWMLFALLAAVPWVSLLVHRRAAAAGDEVVAEVSQRVFGRLARLPLTWALTAGFAASAILAYSAFAWLPRILIDTTGATPVAAGALLSLFATIGVPLALFVPVLVARHGAVRPLFALSVVSGLAGIAGLLLLPTAPTWIWVVLLGIATLLFPLMLVLIGLRTRTPEATVALSSFVQSIGYAIAAVFPLAFGVLHDTTGSWTASLVVLAFVIAATIPAGIIAASRHTVEDEWERRHGQW